MKLFVQEEMKEEDAQAIEEKKAKLEEELKRTDLHEEEKRGLRGVDPYPFTLYVGTNHNFTASSMKEIPLNDEIHGPLPNAYKVTFNVDWTDEGIAKYINRNKVPFFFDLSSLWSCFSTTAAPPDR